MDFEQVFFSLTSAVPYSVLVTDGNPDEPRVVFANEAFASMTGYGASEFLGKNPRFLQGKNSDRVVLDRLRQCLHRKRYFEGCTYNYRKNGEEFLLKWCIQPFSIQGNAFFLAVQKDLTAVTVNGDESLTCDAVVALTQNLTAFYRNNMSVYHAFHEALRTGEIAPFTREEIFEGLTLRDTVTVAASNLTDYLLNAR